jgi:hypothetical protein
MTGVLGSEHVYDCRLTLAIQKDLLPPFSGWWNCLGRLLGDLWPTSHLKSYLRLWKAQSTSSHPCFFNPFLYTICIAGLWHVDWACANRVPVLTEGLDMGEELWLDGCLGLNTDWFCCADCMPSWPGCGGLWSHVGWGIARTQENAMHMKSLILSGALRMVVFYPRGSYPDGALTLKMKAACYSRISVCLPTKPWTLSFNLLINVISLTQEAACHTHACTCKHF